MEGFLFCPKEKEFMFWNRKIQRLCHFQKEIFKVLITVHTPIKNSLALLLWKAGGVATKKPFLKVSLSKMLNGFFVPYTHVVLPLFCVRWLHKSQCFSRMEIKYRLRWEGYTFAFPTIQESLSQNSPDRLMCMRWCCTGRIRQFGWITQNMEGC